MENKMLSVFIVYYLLISTSNLIKANDEAEFNQTLAKDLSRVIWTSVTVTPFEYKLITSPNFPDSYTAGVYDWSVKTNEEGYGVEIIIKSLDISGDFLQIKPGPQATPNEEALVFQYKLNEERKYRVLSNNAYITFQAYTNLVNPGFEIQLRSIGVKEITTIAPSTTPAPITIYPYESSIIYLWGRDHHDFVANVSQEFRYSLAAIAELYCEEKQIIIDPNITIYDNVNYQVIGPCNINWVDNELCTFINYSIGVSYDNETNNYELTAMHLDEMWLKYNLNVNLTQYNLKVYYPPDDSHIIFVWVMIFVIITLLFAIFLYVVHRYSNFFNDILRLPADDDDIDEMKRKSSNRDLMFATEYEDLPPFFQNDPPEFKKDLPQNYFDNNFNSADNLGYEQDTFDPNEDFITSILENPSDQRLTNGDYNLEESNL